MDQLLRKNLILEVNRQPSKDGVAGPLSLHISVRLKKETSPRIKGMGMLENAHFPVEMESFVSSTGLKSQYKTCLDNRLTVITPEGQAVAGSGCLWIKQMKTVSSNLSNKQQAGRCCRHVFLKGKHGVCASVNW